MCARCCFPLIFVKALVPPVWWKIWEVWIQWLCWGSWALEIPVLTLSKLFSQQKVRLVFFFVLNKSWALFKVVMAHDSLNSGKFYLTNIHEYFIISSVSFSAALILVSPAWSWELLWLRVWVASCCDTVKSLIHDLGLLSVTGIEVI